MRVFLCVLSLSGGRHEGVPVCTVTVGRTSLGSSCVHCHRREDVIRVFLYVLSLSGGRYEGLPVCTVTVGRTS